MNSDKLTMTKAFLDIFKDADEFKTKIKSILNIMNYEYADNFDSEKLYILLLGRYGNAHINDTDEYLSLCKFASIIFNHYENLKLRVKYISRIRELEETGELADGGATINTMLSSPEVSGINPDDIIMPYTNNKNVYYKQMSNIERIKILYDSITDNLYINYIEKFKKCFLNIIVNTTPLYYYESNNWNEAEV
jgi:hypothetical protein